MTITYKTNYNEYMNVHAWIIRHYGRADHCSNDPIHESKRFQWANITSTYERDIKNFRQLCRSCHAKLDMTEHSRTVSREKLLGNTLRRKPIAQYAKDGTLIKKHKSLTHAADELGIIRTAISNCVRGETKTAGGYHWRIAS